MNSLAYKKDLFSIFFVAALDNFGLGLVFAMVAPLLFDPTYHFLSPETSLGTREILLGVSTGAFPLMQFFGAPFFGDYSDFSGRKKALLITTAGTAIGFVFSAIAIYFTSLLFFIFTRLLTGLFAGNVSICMASLADKTPDAKSRGKIYSILTVVTGMSWSVAMLVGGYFSDSRISSLFSPPLPFWIAAFLALLAFIIVQNFFAETHPTKKIVELNLMKGFHHIVEALKIKSLRPFFILLLLWAMGWGLALRWFSAYIFQIFQASQQSIAWDLLVQTLFWMVGGSLINVLLLKRFSIMSIALMGMCLTFVLLSLMGWHHSYHTFTLLFWVAAAFSVLALSNCTTLLSVSASEQIQGKAIGLGQSMLAFGSTFIPFLGGIVARINLNLVFPMSSGFFLLGVVIILILYRNRQ